MDIFLSQEIPWHLFFTSTISTRYGEVAQFFLGEALRTQSILLVFMGGLPQDIPSAILAAKNDAILDRFIFGMGIVDNSRNYRCHLGRNFVSEKRAVHLAL